MPWTKRWAAGTRCWRRNLLVDVLLELGRHHLRLKAVPAREKLCDGRLHGDSALTSAGLFSFFLFSLHTSPSRLRPSGLPFSIQLEAAAQLPVRSTGRRRRASCQPFSPRRWDMSSQRSLQSQGGETNRQARKRKEREFLSKFDEFGARALSASCPPARCARTQRAPPVQRELRTAERTRRRCSRALTSGGLQMLGHAKVRMRR